MIFYHGSPIGDLKELKPFLSEHGKPYIYFATNPIVALLYAVKPVPKPFSFYPYGFDGSGKVIYSEYFENAFYNLYSGKKGYLYSCSNLKNIDKPTQINCAYTCEEAVTVDQVTEIPDLYEYFKQQEEKGLFLIKNRSQISDKEMNFILEEIKKDIEKHNLKQNPNHPMSEFVQKRFPAVWDSVKG